MVKDAAVNVVREGLNRATSAVSPLLVTPSETESVRREKAPAVPPAPAATTVRPSSTSGGGRNGTSKMKHRKYLKNTKHFNRYISNLRKKTAKKELELISSIQQLKSI